MNYTEEKKIFIDGIPCHYLCHIQETDHSGIVFPAHYHDYIEILYGITGDFHVYLGSIPYTFGAGDMVLINSKEIHLIESLSQNGGQYYVIRFVPELIYNSLAQNHFEFRYILPFLLQNSNQKKVIGKADINSTYIPDLFVETFTEFERQEYGYELAIRNNISRLFLWILRYLHHTGLKLDGQSDGKEYLVKQMQPAFDYVLNHYETAIKADHMARLSGMSYSYFSRSFNHLMHMNFSEYLNYIRISEAEKKLISTDLSITEIGALVGFSTTSYFIKQFQKHKFVSPKQFRKTMVIKEPSDI